ncbi:MAG: hypothetical protein KC503_35470 [Myxococcales bacterium]|nr:hypothetical protein [Myxococcales bacterium]
MKQRSWLLIAALVFGCSASTSSDTVSATIGPNGGSLRLDDGARLDIPAGALDRDVTFTLARTDVTLPAGVVKQGSTYQITPEGTQFAKPATLTLPTDASLRPASRTTHDIVIYTASQQSGPWTAVGGTASASSVSASIEHLSFFGTGLSTEVGGRNWVTPNIVNVSPLFSEVTVANVANAEVQVTFEGFDADGVSRCTHTATVSPGATLSIPTGPSSTCPDYLGWMQVRASGAVIAVGIAIVTIPNSIINIVLPLYRGELAASGWTGVVSDHAGRFTTIAVANTSDSAATVELTGYTGQGTQHCSAIYIVPKKGRRLFNTGHSQDPRVDSCIDFTGVARVVADRPVFVGAWLVERQSGGIPYGQATLLPFYPDTTSTAQPSGPGLSVEAGSPPWLGQDGGAADISSPDASADSGVDGASPDATVDSGVDGAAPDATIDSGVDGAAPDATIDSGVDGAAPDATVDSGGDGSTAAILGALAGNYTSLITMATAGTATSYFSTGQSYPLAVTAGGVFTFNTKLGSVVFQFGANPSDSINNVLGNVTIDMQRAGMGVSCSGQLPDLQGCSGWFGQTINTWTGFVTRAP